MGFLSILITKAKTMRNKKMNEPKYDRELISIVRFDIDRIAISNGLDGRFGESRFPLVLNKVNRRTVHGKIRFFVDDRTNARVFEWIKLPSMAEVGKWLEICRRHLSEHDHYPRLILAESKTVVYELNYTTIPSVGESLDLLDNIVEFALNYAEQQGWSEEECRSRIGECSQGIIDTLAALSNDSVRTADSDYEHWSQDGRLKS